MRLFIGINFEERVLKELTKISKKFIEQTIKGNFTRKENLHLTLMFLGDVDPTRISEIDECIKTIDILPFIIEIGEIGRFRQKNGDIYWIGIKKCNELNNMHEKLAKNLQNIGFVLEDKPYIPHLTIGRKVKVKDEFDLNSFSTDIPNISMEVDKISLILSHRVDEKLTYTPIKMYKYKG